MGRDITETNCQEEEVVRNAEQIEQAVVISSEEMD